MILAQIFTALASLIIAADFSAIQGGWAHSLGIPLAGVAQCSFWFVPVVAFLPCFLSRRIPAWLRVLGCDFLVLAVVMLPIVVFSLGSRGVTFSGELPLGLTRQLRAELGFPVIIVRHSHVSRIYFPRANDPALIRDALRRHQLQPNA